MLDLKTKQMKKPFNKDLSLNSLYYEIGGIIFKIISTRRGVNHQLASATHVLKNTKTGVKKSLKHNELIKLLKQYKAKVYDLQ